MISAAQASIVQRTITIDGQFGDWDGTKAIAVPPNVDSSPGTNITTNPGQYSADAAENATNPTPPTGQSSCLDKDASYKTTPTPNCGLQSTGRDLQYFSYTFTPTRLYVYVQRYASTTNATDWYFYLDANGDGLMKTGERVLGVSWNGSNGNTTITLWQYNQSAGGGDPIASGGTGDGYDMPGSLGSSVTYNLTTSLPGGGTTGVLAGRQMEAQILWSDVCSGCSGPQNINFHISSSRGTSLPSQLEDNMSGTPGGIITYDLAVAKSASANTVVVGQQFSYSVTVTNKSAASAHSITLTDVLPAQVTFNAFSGTGSYNSGTGLWTIGTIAANSTATATFTVTANAVGTPINTATLSIADTDNSNNSASAQVTINAAAPLLSITKISNVSSGNPLSLLTYTITVQNLGTAAANNVVLKDDVGSYSAIDIDADNNAGNGLLPYFFNAGSSTLTIGSHVYTKNNGADSYGYTLTSGGGGASSGFDANVTDWRIQMLGSMPAGTSFTLTYQAQIQ